jgi:Fur family ferric uptake transcriptional regulator
MGQPCHGRQHQRRPYFQIAKPHFPFSAALPADFKRFLLDTKTMIMVVDDNYYLTILPFPMIEKPMNAPAPMIRLTTQRQIILEELSKVKTHPTASELYDMVRKRLPRIGLGTVYRNLELMADSGMILKIEVGGTQKRFDATTDEHYHIRCSVCGKVDDIDVPVVKELVAQAADTTSYLILGHHVEFTGVCSACQQQNAH